MNKEEVLKVLKNNNRTWKEFNKFMTGQTVGLGKNGKIDYYEWDVKNFLARTRFWD